MVGIDEIRKLIPLRFFSVVVAALFLYGCATTEVATDSAHELDVAEAIDETAPEFTEEDEPVVFGKLAEPGRDLIGEKIAEKIAESEAEKKAEQEAARRIKGERERLAKVPPVRVRPDRNALAELEGGEKLRVLVVNGRKTIRVNGAEGTGSGVNITRVSDTQAKVKRKVVDLPIRLTPVKEFIYLNGRPYRGVVDIYAGEVGLMAVNELYIEPYIVGLINHEISSKWPEAAVKAQAIIARTYALHEKERTGGKGLDERYDLDGSVLGQVYKGVNAEDNLALRAVKETRGTVLTYRGKIALTVYHSNAGGMTESSGNVWTTGYPYLRSVKSPYDKGAPGYSWQYPITPEKLASRLKRAGFKVGRPESVTVTERTRSNRVHKLDIEGSDEIVTLSGKEFREAIGYDHIKSTNFEVSRNGNLFFFTGKGLGHGVGMSQWGAKGMAANGYTYKEILRHYYPGTRLSRVD